MEVYDKKARAVHKKEVRLQKGVLYCKSKKNRGKIGILKTPIVRGLIK